MDEKNFTMQIAHSSKDVLAFFDKYAPTWDDRFGSGRSTTEFHRIRLENFLRLANLKKTDVVVELGVGTGPYLEVISPLVREIIAIDGSKQMLDVLRVKHGHLSNVKLFQIDLEQPFLGEVCVGADLVYSFGLVEHIIDLDTFMLNLRGMLRFGGRAVFTVANARCPWYGMVRTLWKRSQHCSSDRYYTREQVDELLEGFGFAPEAVVYWGYFPAGVPDMLYQLLNAAGQIIGRTWLRRYAGGFMASYVLSSQT